MAAKLPKKEAELFRTVVSCYETKQYRKGIKTADTILKKFPNSGETQAMKGLILNCTNKKEEAYELVKAGLKNDVRSHICWHVYGLLHRSDNNYKEAIKCYLNALRIDTDNQNILRDLSWLQIQMRDLNGFLSSRKRMLDARPNLRPSWVAYAVAAYLSGDYTLAADVVAKYNDSFSAADRADRYEESELLLFQNKCLEKLGDIEVALTHLQTHEASIVDKFFLKTKSAEYLTLLGRFAEAKEAWLALVASQTENFRLHSGLQAAHLELPAELSQQAFALKRLELPSTQFQLSDDQLASLRDLYRNQADFQKSRAVTKIVLTVVQGEELKSSLANHIRQSLHEGVPALFHDICSLVRAPNPVDPTRTVFVTEPRDFESHPIVRLTVEIVDNLIANLQSNGTFLDAPSETDELEVPTSLLWALFLRTHLLERSGRLEEALVSIQQCLDHTPTALDMYMKKGRILKKLGRLIEASVEMDHVRSLDLQDRYLNNKATKYLLRANNIPQAMETVALFTKHDGDPQQTLSDLQCNWYELELAEALARTKQWGPALKKFNSIQKHFTDYVEDMFDFHHFAMRKTTLRMYVDTLVMQDNIFSHKFYQRAARGAMKIYLYLLDTPEDIDGLGHLPAAERKKERAKLKKKRAKDAAKEEAKEKAAQEEAKWSSKPAPETPVAKDTDPTGEKLLQKNFLTEAAGWASYLISKSSSCDADTLALVADVMLRRGKVVQALRAVHCGLAKEPLHPGLTVNLVKIARRVRGQDGSTAAVLSAPASAAVSAEVSALLSGVEVGAFAADYVARVQPLNSMVLALGAARVVIAAASNKGAAAAKQTAVQLVGDEGLWTGRAVNVKNASEILKFISSELKAEVEGEAFRVRAQSAFPHAVVFNKVEAAVVVSEDGEAEAGGGAGGETA